VIPEGLLPDDQDQLPPTLDLEIKSIS